MHYIRLLKTPRISLAPTPTLTALVTIDTDLSDALFAHPATLLARVLPAPTGAGAGTVSTTAAPLALQLLPWTPAARILQVRIALCQAYLRMPLVLHVSAAADEDDANAAAPPLLSSSSSSSAAPLPPLRMPVLIAVTSSPVHHAAGQVTAARRVVRTVPLGTAPALRVWEDAGESMARHVWDGGLVAAALLSEAASATAMAGSGGAPRLPTLAALLGRKGSGAVRVLELGAGCGVAGLALAATCPRAKVRLTDLEDAREVVEASIDEAGKDVRKRVGFEVLDWEAAEGGEGEWDAVLVVECVYNDTSIPLLVKTLRRVAGKGCLVVVVSKRRHESEGVFWELISESGFGVVEKARVLASRGWDGDEGDEEDVEVIEAVVLRRARSEG